MELTSAIVTSKIIKFLYDKYKDDALDKVKDFFTDEGKKFMLKKGEKIFTELGNETFDKYITNPVKNKIKSIIGIKVKNKKDLNKLIYNELEEYFKFSEEEFENINFKLDNISDNLDDLKTQVNLLLDKNLEIKFNETLREITKEKYEIRKKKLKEIELEQLSNLTKIQIEKHILAIKAYYENNDKNEATELFLENYNSSNNKTVKIKSILGLVAIRNDLDDENKATDFIIKNLKYCDDGLNLCDEEKDINSKIPLLAYKFEALYTLLYLKYIRHNLSYEMALKSGSTTAFLEKEGQDKVTKEFEKEFKDINKYYEEFCELGKEDYPMFLMSMNIIIRTMILNIMNRKVLKQEYLEIAQITINIILKLIKNSEKYEDIKNDLVYYYNSLIQIYSILKDKENIEKYCLEILKSNIQDKNLRESACNHLSLLKENKFFGEDYERKNFEDMTLDEIKDVRYKIIETMFERYDIDLNKTDKETELIKIALDDMKPTNIMKFCSNFQIKQLSIYEVGKKLYLPTMGIKEVSCKLNIGIKLNGDSLNLIYRNFKIQNCRVCEKRLKRDNDWEFKSKELLDYYVHEENK